MKKLCVSMIVLTFMSVCILPAQSWAGICPIHENCDKDCSGLQDQTQKEQLQMESHAKGQCQLHENCDMPCGESKDNVFKKSGRGLKKGLVKIKDGFVGAGRKVKNGFKKIGNDDVYFKG